jgi:hypothetical protein
VTAGNANTANLPAWEPWIQQPAAQRPLRSKANCDRISPAWRRESNIVSPEMSFSRFLQGRALSSMLIAIGSDHAMTSAAARCPLSIAPFM